MGCGQLIGRREIRAQEHCHNVGEDDLKTFHFNRAFLLPGRSMKAGAIAQKVPFYSCLAFVTVI